MATRAITPKTSVHPEPEPAAPKVKERTKVEVIGPDATPPESNAIPVNKSGENISVNVKGRHDPVIVPRAVVVVECMAAITVLDALLMNMSARLDGIKHFYGK
jgi:hypothetical protein